jgi:hypothetical protein
VSTTATASGKLANGTHSNGQKKRSKDATNGKKIVERGGQAAKSFVGRQVGVALKAAGGRLHETADSLGKIGRDLHEHGNDALLGDLTQTLAGYVERVSSYLDEADSSSLFNDLERYGRRYPVAFAGAAFVTGYALSRLVKVASAERLQEGE